MDLRPKVYKTLALATELPRPHFALIYIRASRGREYLEISFLVLPKPEWNEGEGGSYLGLVKAYIKNV